MNITDLTRPVLRDRNLLEKQIAAEISLGALTSLENAIKHNHEAALEYGAQILFDNVRKEIAELPNLPLHIACYLFFDRNPEIQRIVLRNHFSSLPEDYQNAYLDEATSKLNSAEEDPEYVRRRCTVEENQLYYYKEVLRQIRTKAIADYDDALAARISSVKFILRYSCSEFATNLEVLRKLPKTVEVCYDFLQQAILRVGGKGNVRSELAVTHPDETIRIDAIKNVIKMSSDKLRQEFTFYAEGIKKTIYKGRGYQVYKGDIKKAVYLALADDPSPTVISLLVNNIMHKEVLMILADKYLDTYPHLSRIARQRGEQITQRSNYSKAYQERRRNAKMGITPASNDPGQV